MLCTAAAAVEDRGNSNIPWQRSVFGREIAMYRTNEVLQTRAACSGTCRPERVQVLMTWRDTSLVNMQYTL